MIFERKVDDHYHWWFAWRPVKLCGPMEWDRMSQTGKYARWVWLRWVLRRRVKPAPYYALPERSR